MRIRGYSLIEILVVMSIFSILTVVVSQSIIVTLSGSRRSRSTTKIRENLEFTVSVMERRLRNAKDITCTGTEKVNYTDALGVTLGFQCSDLSSTIRPGSVNELDNRDKRTKLTSDEVDVTSCLFVCTPSTSGVPASIDISISATDEDSQGPDAASASVTTKIFLRAY